MSPSSPVGDERLREAIRRAFHAGTFDEARSILQAALSDPPEQQERQPCAICGGERRVLSRCPACGAEPQALSVEQEDSVEERLREALDLGPALAALIDGWYRDAYDSEEPDEADPLCHVLNAADAIMHNPAEMKTVLYAEFGPADDEQTEKRLIAAAEAFAALTSGGRKADPDTSVEGEQVTVTFTREEAEALVPASRLSLTREEVTAWHEARDRGISRLRTALDRGEGE